MITMLKRLLDTEIRPSMLEKIMTLENIFIQKMETLLTYRILWMTNT